MSKDLVKNAADEKQVKNASLTAKFNRESELDDVRFLLQTAQGRRFIWRYLEACGIFKTSFTGNSQTFFNEGERNVGLRLLVDVNEADPEGYVRMLKEAKQKLQQQQQGES